MSMLPRVNVVESTMTSRLSDFLRMTPPIFLGSMVGDDPHQFIAKVYKIVHAIKVNSRENVKLTLYQIKDITQLCYT